MNHMGSGAKSKPSTTVRVKVAVALRQHAGVPRALVGERVKNRPKPILRCGQLMWVAGEHDNREFASRTSHVWVQDGEIIDMLCGKSRVVVEGASPTLSEDNHPTCHECAKHVRAIVAGIHPQPLHGRLNAVPRGHFSRYVVQGWEGDTRKYDLSVEAANRKTAAFSEALKSDSEFKKMGMGLVKGYASSGKAAMMKQPPEAFK